MTTEPDKPKPRRRWLQFSLRTLFVLLTVACVCFGLLGRWAYRANEQKRALEWVSEMGGWVRYHHNIADRDALGSRKMLKPLGPRWLVQLLGPDYFQEVYSVDLKGTLVRDLTPLTKLTSLETLHLYDTQVSDLTPLAKLTNLRDVYLINTPVSDLTPLAELTSLESLHLDRTQVSDLTPLEGLTSLYELRLYDTPVNVSDLMPLARLKNLQQLYLHRTQVSEEHVEKLRRALPYCDIDWWPPAPLPPDPSP